MVLTDRLGAWDGPLSNWLMCTNPICVRELVVRCLQERVRRPGKAREVRTAGGDRRTLAFQ